MEAVFECNKNRHGGFEYPFYATSVITESSGYEVLPHWHYHFELLFFTHGTAKVFVGNRCFEVTSGDLILINPCDVHSVSINSNVASKHFIIGFDSDLLNTISNMNFEIKYLLPQAVDINPEYRVLKIDPSYNISLLLEELTLEYINKNIGFEWAVISDIYKLMTLILRGLQNNGLILLSDSILLKNNRLKLRKVLNYIDEHFNEDITPASAASMCFLSYSHFCKLFKSVMHTTFVQYLNYIRIRKAESLLLDGEKLITQIALETGFTDTSYFIKQFRYYKGISPKQYQRLLSKRTLQL